VSKVLHPGRIYVLTAPWSQVYIGGRIYFQNFNATKMK
jgi:hypothetical protein